MIDNEITIVTAFYDIGRKDIKNFERDNDKYLSYFEFLAGIKNKMIIYTQENIKEKILDTRKKHNLEDKTIIITKELQEFDEQGYKKIIDTFKDYNQGINRKNPNNIECISPMYCYLMYLKPFFVCDAIEEGLTNENIMWLDFGFNHGGEFFIDKEQFNFLLEKQNGIDNDKINFFSIKDDDRQTLASIYFSMETFIMGGLIFANYKKWQIFKDDLKKSLDCFSSLGMIDDDQIMLLWCFRNYPQNYNAIRVYFWFDCLYYFIPQNIAKKLKINTNQIKYYKIIKEK
ncbi:protein YibB, partial [Campylobacter jejuni]|nr:protein YibB [Campylobacter jejuni]ECO7153529.1 protein YibB [Campylobacter jejuni]EDP2353564.1 protein YibB [Campylobacter jejuni]EIQ3460101.1 protein YibB [Campylobacter jejuni]ELZ6090030.1 protein YibB [Campylobacter jejuni]